MLALNQLVTHLAPLGYHSVKYTPGIWRYETRDIMFTLAIDNFVIKYFRKQNVDHLLECLRRFYQISVDWTGTTYCGLNLD